MIDFNKLLPINLYHSYVLEGYRNEIADELLKFLESRGEIKIQEGDILCQNYESFNISNSLEIKDWHSRLKIGEGKKICIINTKFINHEAEQALLKIIEEPTADTHFFIIVPDSSVLLDTIISRVHVIKIEDEENSEIKKEIISFISLKPADRINKVALIIKNNKDEENSGQLRFYATSFVNELESVFYKKFKKDVKDNKIKFILDELHKARGYLSTPGASVKMILEHLALIID